MRWGRPPFLEVARRAGVRTLAARKTHEPYDNEVGKRWTEIAKATDNLRGLRSANFADRWA